jgi:hypothetical protein
MTSDLFGNIVEEPKPKTARSDYTEYINSSTWKRLRDAKIKQVGGVCEHCGLSKWSVTLEVHHKTYERFKHEKLEDLEVLCHKCHEKADAKRKEEKEEHREHSPLTIGFEKWMDRGNNKGWHRMSSSRMGRCWKEFLKELSYHTGRKYDVPFKRMEHWN